MPRRAAGNPTVAERNVEVVRDMLVLLMEGWRLALDRYDEYAAPGLEWRGGATGAGGPEAGAVYRGRDSFRRYWTEVEDAWTSMGFEIVEIRPVGDHVVLSLGRSRAQGGQSGIEFEGELGLVWRMRDGPIAWGRTFLSHAEAERQADRLAEESARA